jgi:hypothetical protein
MKYEIVRVGIPIRKQDISISFLEVIDNIKNRTDCIAITTVHYPNEDEICSPAGHKILFDNLQFIPFTGTMGYNKINTYNIWEIKNERGEHRDPFYIVQHLLSLLENQFNKLGFNRVYMFTPGSPNVYDGITTTLQRTHPVTIIDAESSIHIISRGLVALYPEFNHTVIRNYTNDFLNNTNKSIIKHKINIFGSIDNRRNYNTKLPMLNQFFQDLRELLDDNDIFWYCTIKNYDDSPIINQITFKEAFNNIDMFINSVDIYTYGVYKLKEC